MGVLYYGGPDTLIEIDDRALAHLQMVIATKLRRHEKFTLSWRHVEGQPRGRSTIWIDPSIPLQFTYDEPVPPELNHEWLVRLAQAATSTNGIMLTPEQLGDELTYAISSGD